MITKKCLELFEELSEDEDKYNSFYGAFAKNIKLGVHEDAKYRTRLVDLLRFDCTNCEQQISMKQYVEKMVDSQKSIFYLTGETAEKVTVAPVIERLRACKIPVLLLTDPIDEYAVQRIDKYSEFKLVNCGKTGVDLSFCTPKREPDLAKTFETLCAKVSEWLVEHVEKVIISDTCTSSPCTISASEFGWTANMERIMKAQCLRSSGVGAMMGGRKVFELNPDHPIIQKLQRKVRAEKFKAAKDLTFLLYETALISSEFALKAPTKYSNKIFNLINLGVVDDDSDCGESEDRDEKVPEEKTPVTEGNTPIEENTLDTEEKTPIDENTPEFEENIPEEESTPDSEEKIPEEESPPDSEEKITEPEENTPDYDQKENVQSDENSAPEGPEVETSADKESRDTDINSDRENVPWNMPVNDMEVVD